MRVLIVSPYLPHPQSGHGTGVFMHGLLQRLCRRHDVTLVSFCDDAELKLAEDLKALPIKLHTILREKGIQGRLIRDFLLAAVRLLQLLRSIVLWRPYYVSKWWHAGAARLLSRLTESERYDIVQVEFPFMGQYKRFIREGKTVLHEHDVAYRPAYRRYKMSRRFLQRLLLFLEWCRWSLYERKIVQRFDHVITVTAQDQKLLERLTGASHISYLPRAVEAADGTPAYESREPHSLLFVGTFSHAPNVDAGLWLAEVIFPLVLKRIPEATLYLVGANPPPALNAIAEKYAGIRVLGFVDNIEQYYQRCRVFVAPLRFGGGVKVKILHAMAHAIPVVTTRVGIEGIEGISPAMVAIGNSEQTIAEHIYGLLKSPLHADQIGRKGREMIEEFYSWESVLARWDAVYERVVKGRTGG